VTVGFDSFIAAFPEFEKVPKELVDAKIAEAKLEVAASVWGAKTDLGVSYLTAHLLSMSPFGQHARLIPPNAKVTREDALTTYERRYRALVRQVASGFRVVNDCPPT
jgi:hypothetical protein